MFIGLIASLFAAAANAAPTSGDAAISAALRSARADILNASNIRFSPASPMETLLRDLKDGTPSVRLLALSNLREFVNRSVRAREAVIDIYMDPKESFSLRKAAAKTLSRGSQYREVRDRLIDYARFGKDSGLRAVSLKALYPEAGRVSSTRSEVLAAIVPIAQNKQEAPQVRRGALWSLFSAMDKSRVREVVLHPAFYADSPTRIVALKSLFEAMNNELVADRILKLAADDNEPFEVREVAVRLLSRSIDDERVLEFLSILAFGAPATDLRSAAQEALEPGAAAGTKFLRYFHIPHEADGKFVDPLENE